ncbi:MAG: hypothetical protein HYT87_19165 [Nitrospirae bacterium]|nr:hypothetical protein [Nitrospirota bacterium]
MIDEVQEPNGTAWTDPVIGEIAGLVAESAGFTLKGKKAFRIEMGVKERMAQLEYRSAAEYLLHLRGPLGSRELAALTQTLTVNETHFFRHAEQFGLLRSWLDKRSAPSELNPLRALCAGCSTGEEVYTVAMVLSDAFPWVRPGSIQVVGADIDGGALEVARGGIYPGWSVSRAVLPPGVTGRHLLEVGSGAKSTALGSTNGTGQKWQVAEPIRKLCRFERKNLMSDALGGPFEIVFCRNVLIYFDDPHKQVVLDNLVQSMKIGAVLFCGYAESLVHQSHYLDLREQNGVVYYVRWTPDRRAAQAEIALDDNRRLLIEEGGIPLIFMSTRPAAGSELPSASLVLAGVLSSNTTPETLSQRIFEKRDRWMNSLLPAGGGGLRARMTLDLDGLRFAEEPYLKILVDFARDLAKRGVGLTTRPSSNPRIRDWMGRSPQRELFRVGSSLESAGVANGSGSPQPCRHNRSALNVSSKALTPQSRAAPLRSASGTAIGGDMGIRAGFALAALEDLMKERAALRRESPEPGTPPRPVGAPSLADGMDLLTADLPPQGGAPTLEFREAESPLRIVVSGRWPDDMPQAQRTEIEGKLARIAGLGSRSEGRGNPNDSVVLDLSTLDYAERWLADALKRFRDSIRPVRLTVVGSMGTFRWLARMGAGDLA